MLAWRPEANEKLSIHPPAPRLQVRNRVAWQATRQPDWLRLSNSLLEDAYDVDACEQQRRPRPLCSALAPLHKSLDALLIPDLKR